MIPILFWIFLAICGVIPSILNLREGIIDLLLTRDSTSRTIIVTARRSVWLGAGLLAVSVSCLVVGMIAGFLQAFPGITLVTHVGEILGVIAFYFIEFSVAICAWVVLAYRRRIIASLSYGEGKE